MNPTILGNAELIGTFKDGSPEWHAARADLIGASDVPIILGLSSYKSPFTLWQEKAGLLTQAPVSADQQRKRDYGHYLEPFVEVQYLTEHPDHELESTGTWRSVEHPWQGCNPDRLLTLPDGTKSLVQIKTANFMADWEVQVPPAYVAQVRWELDTFGFDSGILAAWFNVGGQYREWEIKVDPFVADATRDRVRAFADSITAGEPPEIDGSFDTYQTLRRLNPSLERGKVCEVPEDIGYEYILALRLLKAADERANKWRGHLLAHMSTAQYATLNGLRIASRIAKGDNPPYLQESKIPNL